MLAGFIGCTVPILVGTILAYSFRGKAGRFNGFDVTEFEQRMWNYWDLLLDEAMKPVESTSTLDKCRKGCFRLATCTDNKELLSAMIRVTLALSITQDSIRAGMIRLTGEEAVNLKSSRLLDISVIGRNFGAFHRALIEYHTIRDDVASAGSEWSQIFPHLLQVHLTRPAWPKSSIPIWIDVIRFSIIFPDDSGFVRQ
jgi:hypothetical protein